ncbi:hypothetical protein EGS38_05910 [Neisseria chenwenguii]|nr:hypothetical protein EGS38_05910 [Neisseria chenwenguii]
MKVGHGYPTFIFLNPVFRQVFYFSDGLFSQPTVEKRFHIGRILIVENQVAADVQRFELCHFPVAQSEVEQSDLAGGFAVCGGRIADSAMVSRALAEMPLCLAASPGYLAAHDTPCFSDGLAAHRLIVRRLGTDKLMTWHFRSKDGGIRTCLPAAPALIFSEPEAVLEAVLAGCGIAELPLYLAQAHLKTGRLKTVLSKQRHKSSARLVLQYPTAPCWCRESGRRRNF